MQVLSMVPSRKTDKPMLLFLHGSFHGAWCWSERYFEYFTQRGYPVVAPSWRGTGGTYAGDGVQKVQIGQHVEDLRALLTDPQRHLSRMVDSSSSAVQLRPVVVSHSFGGLAVMKMLEEDIQTATWLRGIVNMCVVPPSGNGKMTLRYLQRSLSDSWKITAGFAMKRCLTDTKLCRELFFGGDKITLPNGTIEDYGVSDADILRYQSYFARDSQATIDLLNLGKQLPSSSTDRNGMAFFVPHLPPRVVMGATDDFIVDRVGLEETAVYYDAGAPILIDSPHDIMLGAKWENGALAVEDWLSSNIVPGPDSS
jgi:pimeloyl-ACP methyl ester carboxylesterase